MKTRILALAVALTFPLAASAQLLPLMANQMVKNRQQAAVVAKSEAGQHPLGCAEGASPAHEGALTACITGQHGHGTPAVEAAQLQHADAIVEQAKQAGGSGGYSTMTIAGIRGLDTLQLRLSTAGVGGREMMTAEIVGAVARLAKAAPRPVSILVYGPGDDDRDWIEGRLRKGDPGGEINAIYNSRFSIVMMEGG